MDLRPTWRRYEIAEPVEQPPVGEDELRLFPIVGWDLCYEVAALLVQGCAEEAGELVPDRAWVASPPLYG
jgi:hypothetical protein